jgi:ABC-type multidrug transport system ATPase subunit
MSTAPLPGSAVLLQATGLNFSYPGLPLFSGWSATLFPGITLVSGGDGRGKSSLLRLLAGQLAAHSGDLRLRGVSLRDTPEAYRAQVFFTDARTEAFDTLTPVQYFDAQQALYPAFDRTVLAPLVDGLSLDEQMGKQLFMLSTGSKRKVFLAAALASGAPLTLLDMPFAALDKASIRFVTRWLEDAWANTGRALVLADYAAPEQLTLAKVIDLGDG